MTVNVNVHEAKTPLSRLLERVAAGERVLISRAGTPVAALVPHQRTKVVFGGLKGQIGDHGHDIVGPDPEITAMFSDDTFDDDAPARSTASWSPRRGTSG